MKKPQGENPMEALVRGLEIAVGIIFSDIVKPSKSKKPRKTSSK